MGEPTFHFDSTDTVPYWYEPLVRYFPGLQMNQFLNRAEHWILGQWKARPDANWWDLEPRKARYDERRYSLWDHRHGSMPIVERHGTYLEWHAMMCVAGELLESRALAKSDEASQTFDDWLARFLQTEPHCWLSDHREPVPLEVRLWAQDSRPEGEWLRDARADEFIPELGIGKDGRR